MSREGALWIGGLEPYMDEEFLLQAMRSSGEDNILSIKVIKNKFTGGVAGYGFINFPSDSIALTAMHKLNGKMIPNSRPPARYKLNHNSNRILPGEKNYSIWVGDLSPEIDDLMLYKFFSARFQTIISAKVVLDEMGTSKGFGFIRFGNETEQTTALSTMQGIAGLGSKPIKVSIAVQKTKDPNAHHAMEFPSHLTQTIQKQLTGQFTGHAPPAAAGPDPYYNQYNNYWSNMAAWQQYNNYYQQYPGQEMQGEAPVNPPLPPTPHENGNNGAMESGDSTQTTQIFDDEESSIFAGPSNQVVEHSKPLDYYKLDRKYFSKSAELYDTMEESGWWYVED